MKLVTLYHGTQDILSLIHYGFSEKRLPVFVTKSKRIAREICQEKGTTASICIIEFEIPENVYNAAIKKELFIESEDLTIGHGASQINVVDKRGIKILNKFMRKKYYWTCRDGAFVEIEAPTHY